MNDLPENGAEQNNLTKAGNRKFVTMLTPSPDWYYYKLWHILQQAKLEIDSSLMLLSEVEDSDDYANETVLQSLNRTNDYIEEAKENI